MEVCRGWVLLVVNACATQHILLASISCSWTQDSGPEQTQVWFLWQKPIIFLRVRMNCSCLTFHQLPLRSSSGLCLWALHSADPALSCQSWRCSCVCTCPSLDSKSSRAHQLLGWRKGLAPLWRQKLPGPPLGLSSPVYSTLAKGHGKEGQSSFTQVSQPLPQLFPKYCSQSYWREKT